MHTVDLTKGLALHNALPVTRIEKFKKRFNMFNDNYRDQVENKLGLVYAAFKELKLDVQLHHQTNLYKQIVNKISHVYSFGVEREFTNEQHAELYNTLRVNKIMAQANTYLNAFNDVLVQVTHDDDKIKIVLRLPHRTEVTTKDGKIDTVKYYVENLGDKGSIERWAFWSAEEHYYIDRSKGEDTKVLIEGNEEGINPFGVLPFVEMHNGWRDEHFFDAYTGDDMVNSTIDICVHLTFLNHIIKSQSFKQLVGKGDNIQSLSGQLSDPLSILTLSGQNTEIDVLDMQSNYEQLHTVIQGLANDLAVAYGISPSQFRMTGAPSSGFALQMENLQVDKFVQSQQDDFVHYEKELFELIKIVGGEFGTVADGSLDSVVFAKPSYPESRETKLNNDAKAIDLGLTSSDKILKSQGVQDADLVVAENIEARNKLYERVSGSNLPPTSSALGL
jgi:hypothetical protein